MARNNRNQQQVPELQERVVYINRVAKVVKGGRRFQLSALVVVGDGHGHVGVGMGKSQEVPAAIRKGAEDAKKNMFEVPITEDGSIPHEVIGEFCSAKVIIKPAHDGTGVIAGGAVRPLLELAGVKNVLSKSLGTDNAVNTVKAAAVALQQLRSPKETAAARGVSEAHIFGWEEK